MNPQFGERNRKVRVTFVIFVRITRTARVFPMTLSSMVLSRDWQEVSVLECILGGLQIEVAIEKEPQRALERLNRSKIDAVIVDCDLNGSSQFLRDLQSIPRADNSVPLVIMGAPQSKPSLDATGALFAFEKPISVEQAVRTLTAARTMILDGRLRYHRAGVELPVSVKCKGRKAIEGYLLNISQGGMLIRSEQAIETDSDFQVSFTLPNNATTLRAQATVAWQDRAGNLGIRFAKIAPRQQRTLELWLAQQFLAN
jgi:PilZ domain-containing protein